MVMICELMDVPEEVLRLRVGSGWWYGKLPTYNLDMQKTDNPIILVDNPVDNRTYKIPLGEFEAYIKRNVTRSDENLEDALFYLEGALPYLPEGIMKRNVKRLLESTKHEQAT